MKFIFLPLAFFIFLSACTRSEIRNNRPVETPPSDVLTLEKISESLEENKKSYESCTIKTLRESRKKLPANASLFLRIIIAGNGKVSSVTKDQVNFTNPQVEKCYLDAIAKIQFARTLSGGELDISYPFNFLYLRNPKN